MDFSLTDEQRMLADSAQRYVQDHTDLERHRKRRASLQPLDQQAWQELAELGWLAMPFAQRHGGLEAGPVETMVLMEALGEGLVMTPYLATVVLAGGVLRRADANRQADTVPALVAGRLQLALAIDEYQRYFSLENTALVASAQEGTVTLSGTKACVLNGDQAQAIIVLARTAGEPGDRQGLSLFWVEADTAGLTRRPHRTVAGRQGAELVFDNVAVPTTALIGDWHGAHDLVRDVLNEGILALAAEAVGALSVLFTDTVEYSKNRQQFGVPIGRFQVLQHRMADMFMALEQCRSLLLAATLKVAEGHEDAQAAVHALKAQLGQGGRRLAQEAIQLHGGMGMTDELAVGHFVKKLLAAELLFGTADQHLQALGARG